MAGVLHTRRVKIHPVATSVFATLAIHLMARNVSVSRWFSSRFVVYRSPQFKLVTFCSVFYWIFPFYLFAVVFFSSLITPFFFCVTV